MNYKTKRWKEKRTQILKRDKYLCRESLRYGKKVEADTVHHIYPADEYPNLAFKNENLISLCRSVHDKMHDRRTNKLTSLGKKLQKRIPRPLIKEQI